MGSINNEAQAQLKTPENTKSNGRETIVKQLLLSSPLKTPTNSKTPNRVLVEDPMDTLGNQSVKQGDGHGGSPPALAESAGPSNIRGGVQTRSGYAGSRTNHPISAKPTADPPSTQYKNPLIMMRHNLKDYPVKIEPQTKTLIIGDSNVKYYQKIPNDVQVVCIRGARFSDIEFAIETLHTDKNNMLNHLIIAAGINERDAADPKEPIRDLKSLIEMARIISKFVHFLAISAPQDYQLNLRQRRTIAVINKEASHLMDEGCCLPAVENGEADPSDRSNLHFSRPAATDHFRLLLAHVNSLNWLLNTTPPIE
jgi:hypothetical protein